MSDLQPPSLRQERKADHLKYALEQEEEPAVNWLEDIHLIHRALPELDLKDVDVGCRWLGKSLRMPLIINAITGGIEWGLKINKSLGRISRETGVAVAVGSQTVAVKEKAFIESFRVVRRENPRGIVLANLSALSTPEDAAAAVEMLEADALQLHLNAAQEAIMAEGECDFRGVLENIQCICREIPVPIIVKEVGCGISQEVAGLLFGAGVRYLDIGGRGGTNFVSIEENRLKRMTVLRGWGIPMPASLLEVVCSGLPMCLIAGGGIKNPLDMAKVLVLGADLVGVAGTFLKTLGMESEAALLRLVREWEQDLRKILFLQGAGNLEELRKKPAVITGKTREWLEQRGIDTYIWARK